MKTDRVSECILCGARFAPRPMHPMIESAWCPDCWAAIVERMAVDGDARTAPLFASVE